MSEPKLGDEIKAARLARKLSRNEFAKLCGVDYATVANWELNRNAPKGPTLEKVRDVMAGKVGAIKLTAAEEALLQRIMQEGGFKSREEFFSSALLSLITKGTLLLAISLAGLCLMKAQTDCPSAEMTVAGKTAQRFAASMIR